MSSPLSIPHSNAPDDLRGEVGAQLSTDALELLAAESPLLPPKEPLGARMASYFGRHLILLFCVSFSCLWAILSLPSPFNRPDFAPGQNAPRDYIAPQNAFLPDRTETTRRRAAAAALVTPAYDPAPSAQSQALFALHEVAEKSREAAVQLRDLPAQNRGSLVVLALEKRFEARAGWRPGPKLLPTLRALQSARWATLESAGEAAIRAVYLTGRIRSDVGEDLVTIRALLRRQIARRLDLSASEREIALDLAGAAARFPNVVVNQRATDEARERAAGAVLPVFLRIRANTPLVRQDERVGAEQFAQLQELGLVAPRFRPLEALANGALCLLLVLGAAAYLARARRDLVVRPAALWLVATVPTLFLLVFRLFLGVPHADFMMVPLAATSAMLLTVLIDARVGLPAGFVVAALCALMARSEAGLFLAATLSAWIGALSVTQLASRLALVRSVLMLAVSNAILAFALGILRESNWEELVSSAAWSAIAGLGSVAAMAGLAILLERPFGITSHLRLLELLAPDETVIQRMQLEAPGTYTHSMTVALLAESAAKAVGADPLLCRVAGLYHDIGKLRRPHCFIENQSGDNIHDRLTPGLSALIIKAHVKDGLELGRAVRLPVPVLDVIASHHGTSLIAYFYHRALKLADEGTGVSEATFRYPGPKPESREAAIVMLADSIEASARTLPQISPEILQTHVHTLIAAKVSEGELSDCDLSLKDLQVVRDAFASVLRGVLHGRIAYPDPLALAETSGDWVRETLGEENKSHPTRRGEGPNLAPGAQRRQNKKQRATSAAANTKIELPAQSGVAPDASPYGARRRFKPPFHAPRNGTSTGPTNATQNTPTQTEPELEPRLARASARPQNGAAPGENAANGARNGAANGAAPLSHPQKTDRS